MPGRKLNIIKRLGKKQNVFGSPKHVSKISARSKFQKNIDISNSVEKEKISLNKALFAEKIKGIQNEFSNQKIIFSFKKRQETRKGLIELIKKNKGRLPDSTIIHLEQ